MNAVLQTDLQTTAIGKGRKDIISAKLYCFNFFFINVGKMIINYIKKKL